MASKRARPALLALAALIAASGPAAALPGCDVVETELQLYNDVQQSLFPCIVLKGRIDITNGSIWQASLSHELNVSADPAHPAVLAEFLPTTAILLDHSRSRLLLNGPITVGIGDSAAVQPGDVAALLSRLARVTDNGSVVWSSMSVVLQFAPERAHKASAWAAAISAPGPGVAHRLPDGQYGNGQHTLVNTTLLLDLLACYGGGGSGSPAGLPCLIPASLRAQASAPGSTTVAVLGGTLGGAAGLLLLALLWALAARRGACAGGGPQQQGDQAAGGARDTADPARLLGRGGPQAKAARGLAICASEPGCSLVDGTTDDYVIVTEVAAAAAQPRCPSPGPGAGAGAQPEQALGPGLAEAGRGSLGSCNGSSYSGSAAHDSSHLALDAGLALAKGAPAACASSAPASRPRPSSPAGACARCGGRRHFAAQPSISSPLLCPCRQDSRGVGWAGSSRAWHGRSQRSAAARPAAGRRHLRPVSGPLASGFGSTGQRAWSGAAARSSCPPTRPGGASGTVQRGAARS
jgi:hypothetical protein